MEYIQFNTRYIVHEFNADGYYTRFYLRSEKPCVKRISRIEYNRNPPFSAAKKLNCYRRFIKIAPRQWSLFAYNRKSGIKIRNENGIPNYRNSKYTQYIHKTQQYTPLDPKTYTHIANSTRTKRLGFNNVQQQNDHRAINYKFLRTAAKFN